MGVHLGSQGQGHRMAIGVMMLKCTKYVHCTDQKLHAKLKFVLRQVHRQADGQGSLRKPQQMDQL